MQNWKQNLRVILFVIVAALFNIQRSVWNILAVVEITVPFHGNKLERIDYFRPKYA